MFKACLQGGLCVRVVEPQKTGMLPLARSLVTSVASDVLDDEAVEESLSRLRPYAGCCTSTSQHGFEGFLFPHSEEAADPDGQEDAPRLSRVSRRRDANRQRVLRRLRYKGLSQAWVRSWRGFTLFVERLHSQNQRRQRCAFAKVHLHNVCNVFMYIVDAKLF